MTLYYLLVEEWNYPTESGCEPFPVAFTSDKEVLAKSAELAKAELPNFREAAGLCLDPAPCERGGYIITTKSGLDPFYYYARVIPVEPIC